MMRLPSTVAAVAAAAVSTTISAAAATATATAASSAAAASVAASTTTSRVLCHLGELGRDNLLGVREDLDEVASNLGLSGWMWGREVRKCG